MSEIRVTTLKDTSGGNSSTTEQIASGRAKAWVNFNGTGAVAIRANFNVNSITDNATGNYTVNFTTALADANYCVNATTGSTTTSNMGAPRIGANTGNTFTTSAVQVFSTDTAEQNYIDLDRFFVSVFR